MLTVTVTTRSVAPEPTMSEPSCEVVRTNTPTGYVRAMATDIGDVRFRIRNMRDLLQNDATGRTKENAEASEVARMVEEVLGMVDELASAVQDLDQRTDGQ